jgi:hypothetical protein
VSTSRDGKWIARSSRGLAKKKGLDDDLVDELPLGKVSLGMLGTDESHP